MFWQCIIIIIIIIIIILYFCFPPDSLEKAFLPWEE